MAITDQYRTRLGRLLRPRFSVFTSLVLLSLLSVYFAMWGPTLREARRWMHLRERYVRFVDGGLIFEATYPSGDYEAAAVAPLLLREDTLDDDWVVRRRFYLWFLGPALRIPLVEMPLEGA